MLVGWDGDSLTSHDDEGREQGSSAGSHCDIMIEGESCTDSLRVVRR